LILTEEFWIKVLDVIDFVSAFEISIKLKGNVAVLLQISLAGLEIFDPFNNKIGISGILLIELKTSKSLQISLSINKELIVLIDISEKEFLS
tara:strand:+ start:315 stop:590 length:276 start_codon:yes stop_codon:yes gene_type:complete